GLRPRGADAARGLQAAPRRAPPRAAETARRPEERTAPLPPRTGDAYPEPRASQPGLRRPARAGAPPPPPPASGSRCAARRAAAGRGSRGWAPPRGGPRAPRQREAFL